MFNSLFFSGAFSRRRRGGGQQQTPQQQQEPEEDLTKDMEDPTPVPNMEEVILPKIGIVVPRLRQEKKLMGR